jgi:hypothetical protein
MSHVRPLLKKVCSRHRHDALEDEWIGEHDATNIEAPWIVEGVKAGIDGANSSEIVF